MIVKPVPKTKNPIRNNEYDLVTPAGIKTAAPAAIIISPSDIPFLYPVNFSIEADGNAITA